MNIVIYARYSSDNQSETSIEQQLKVCREYCKRNNYIVVYEYYAAADSSDLLPLLILYQPPPPR